MRLCIWRHTLVNPMELLPKLQQTLDEGGVFTHSSVDLAKGRLEERPDGPIRIMLLVDAYSPRMHDKLFDYIRHYLDYYESADNYGLYVPEYNATAKRLVKALKAKDIPTSGCRIGQVDWKKSEEELKEELLDYILDRVDAVLFVTTGKGSEFRSIFRRACETGYLTTRKIQHETRNT